MQVQIIRNCIRVRCGLSIMKFHFSLRASTLLGRVEGSFRKLSYFYVRFAKFYRIAYYLLHIKYTAINVALVPRMITVESMLE